ncbi:hypothetical protein [Sandaracinus amylolyticus]|uniref:hypothetical protein n=1 Tax=Sandaracinus amylolyticus TaxID=927083 RepID=UPI001F396418|nr:hypothetical protein [Sandaracinus amylolyticus]UJR82421.1 Hypothetical protein I5071_44860 [Sandaracinus amylolyticus]
MRRLLAALASSLVLACTPVDVTSSTPCLHTDRELRRTLEGHPETVDLLIVLDDSSLGRIDEVNGAIARLTRSLATGDRDGDGRREVPALPLRVAVVTSHLGVAGHDVPSCTDGRFGALGDDGVPRSGDPSCGGSSPVITFEPGDDADAFVEAVACAARVGTSGCGWEQPLEAALKALMPTHDAADLVFPRGLPMFREGAGHGFAEYDDFAVPYPPLLAAVIVTDEDDCSVEDVSLFDPAAYDGEPLETRCRDHRDALHAIARYVEGEHGESGLLGLRWQPDDLFIAALVGAPLDALEPDAGGDYDGVLAHERMQLVPDPTQPSRVLPSCSGPGITAFPPRRIVEALDDLDDARVPTFLRSICAPDLEPSFDALGEALGNRILGARCQYGITSGCVVEESLPEGMTCDALPGRTRRTIEDGRQVCELARVPYGSGEPGWALVDAFCPPGASTIHLELAPVPGAYYEGTCPHTLGPDGGTCFE